MNEFKISIVGRARTGKSLLLTRFVAKPKDIIALSNSGSDSTKVPTELVLRNDISSTSISYYEKGNSKSNKISVSELANFHERLKTNKELQEKVTHIVIEAEPNEWLKEVLKKVDTNQLTIIDTEGVSGDVKELNIMCGKADLFILLLKSDSKTEFAASIDKMRSVLLGANVWYAASLPNQTLTSNPTVLPKAIQKLETEAKKIKEDFSEELSKLEKEESLLNIGLIDCILKDSILAIPNISLDEYGDNLYEQGRKYTNEKLEELLIQVMDKQNEGTDFTHDTINSDVRKKIASIDLLTHFKNISLDVLERQEITHSIQPSCNKSAFLSHLNAENRLITNDNFYLVGKQWEVTNTLRELIYRQLSKVNVDKTSCLTPIEQVSLAMEFYSNFSKKIINTNYFIKSTDGREGTEQASIVIMLHAKDIANELNKGNIPVKDILKSVMITGQGWEKNSLIDSNPHSNIYTPIFYANKVNTTNLDALDKFYYMVIKPYTVYAIYNTLIEFGYRTRDSIIEEYQPQIY